jgi:hypothetical protein
LKKQKSQGKAKEVTVNSKEENSLDFCLDLFQEFGLSRTICRNLSVENQLKIALGPSMKVLFQDNFYVTEHTR